MPGWGWFLIGIFLGVNIGIFIMAMCKASGDDDTRHGRQEWQQ